MGQAILDGVLFGGLLGLASLGFSLVWGVMDLLNIAHGTLVIVGAYLCFFFVHSVLKLDPFLTVPLVVIVMFVFGYLVQRFSLNRVVRQDMLFSLTYTFGLNLALVNILLWVYAADIRSVNSSFTGPSPHLGSVVVPQTRLVIFVVALLLAAVAHLFLMHTRYGRAIRATALDRDAARLSGVNINQVYAWTFGVACSLAAATGALTSMVMPFTPFSGDSFLNDVFVVTVLGGLGNVGGAVIGGILLGLLQSLAATYVGSGYQDAVSFLIFVLVLVFRPQGLFGNRFYGQTN